MEKITKSLSGFEKYVRPNKVFMFSKSYCPYCTKAKGLLNELNVPFEFIECDEVSLSESEASELYKKSGIKSYPNIFIGEKSIGGCDNIFAAYKTGKLYEYLKKEGVSFQELKD